MAQFRLLKIFSVLAFVALFFALSIKIDVEISVNGPCRLRPQAEWRFFRNTPSLYTSEFERFDRATGTRINTFQFDRPDLLTVEFADDLFPGSRISEGQILARLDSRKQREDLDVAKKELNAGRAMVDALATGEKAAVEQEAVQSKKRAEQVLEFVESSFERLSNLHNLNLCSETALESIRTEKKLAEIDLSIAEAHLAAVRSGEKPALVAVAEKESAIVEERIANLEHWITHGDIRSPIDGVITTTLVDSALLRVAKLDTMIALVPVAQPRIKWITPGQHASIQTLGVDANTLDGTVISVDKQAMFIQGKTFFLVSVSIRNDTSHLMPGMEGRLNISCGKVKLLDWLADKLGAHTFRQINA